MDTQCKMVRDLLSVKEQSQLLVKETSSRLGNELYSFFESFLWNNFVTHINYQINMNSGFFFYQRQKQDSRIFHLTHLETLWQHLYPLQPHKCSGRSEEQTTKKQTSSGSL